MKSKVEPKQRYTSNKAPQLVIDQRGDVWLQVHHCGYRWILVGYDPTHPHSTFSPSNLKLGAVEVLNSSFTLRDYDGKVVLSND